MYEWFAVRTLRSVRIVAVLGVVLTALGAVGLTFLMREVDADLMSPTDHLVLAVRTNIVLPLVVLTVSSSIAGSDTSRGLVVVPVLRARGRTRLWVARGLLAVGLALVVAIVVVAVSAVGVGIVAGFAPAAWGPVLAGALAQGVGWAALGLGLGLLVRGIGAAVALPLVLAYVGEPALRAMVAAGPGGDVLASLAPFAAATSLVRSPAAFSTAFDTAGTLPWLQAAVTFLVPCALVAVAGWWRFRRADLSPRSVG